MVDAAATSDTVLMSEEGPAHCAHRSAAFCRLTLISLIHHHHVVRGGITTASGFSAFNMNIAISESQL